MFDPTTNSEQVLIIGAYLTKIKLTTKQRRQRPFDNLYKYLFSRNGDLYMDLITIDRIMSPLISFTVPESTYPLHQNLASCKNHVFIIQYPFFRDSTLTIEERAVLNFNKMVHYLFDSIPLPDVDELKLYDYFISNDSTVESVIEDVDDLQDIEEH